MTDTVNTEVQPDADLEAQKAAEEQAKADALLETFQSTAIAALDEADTTTGTIPDAYLEPVKAAYRALEGGAKYKNRAKAFVADSMRDVLGAGDLTQMFKAVAWNSIQDAIAQAPAKAPAAAKPTVSPNKLHADKVQALRLALDLVESSDLPEGVTEDWEDEIEESDNLSVLEEYVAWMKDDSEDKDEEPAVSHVIKQAAKIAFAKAPRKGGRTGSGSLHVGPKRDVGVHIENAFAHVEAGTFLTVSEIRNTPSEEYGDDAPSAGAINQRLRPPSGKPTTIPGIVVEQNADGVWGARKI